MRKTTNYELNIADGSDRYNHLTIDNPNYEKIDTIMKENEDSAVQTATELKSGTVHAITRNKPNASMFRFVATSDYTSGETFTVDGQQVTALLPNGATLGTGAYHINANVLCCLVGTNMTVYTIGVAENIDATTLEGHSADYFATADSVAAVQTTATSAGIVANNALNEANSALSEANNNKAKTIWTNPDVNHVYNGGTISVEIERNGIYFIDCGVIVSTKTSPVATISLCVDGGDLGFYYNGKIYRRKYTVDVDSNTITFNGCTTDNGEYANWFIIPMKIYKV